MYANVVAARWSRQTTDAATGFKTEIRLWWSPDSHPFTQGAQRKTKLARERNQSRPEYSDTATVILKVVSPDPRRSANGNGEVASGAALDTAFAVYADGGKLSTWRLPAPCGPAFGKAVSILIFAGTESASPSMYAGRVRNLPAASEVFVQPRTRAFSAG